ncbi:MAG: hypothetical protein AAB497_00715 [Patescibacteria group bacterium]|mgnify:CR=1 FL=1
MAFSFFTKRIQNEGVALLIDIGSASVGGALVKIEKGRAPHILATTREDISFQEELSSTRFVLAMNHALDRALKTVQAKIKTTGVGAPAHIFCTLSSPWFILKSRHIHIAREKAFEVSERSLEEFLNEEIEKLKGELKETLPPKDVRIIEKNIIQMKLNGYEVKNPYGREISQMELTMTVGVSSLRVIQSIERKLSNFFHTTSLHFGVFPLAAFSTIRDMFSDEKNFLFLDITGEATDVSLVNNDLLVSTMSFPYGKNFFIREISTGLHTPHEEAVSLLNMFLAGTLDGSKHNDVKNLVEYVENKWLARFEKILASFSGQGVLPRTVFFTADTDIAELFSKIIGRAKIEPRTSEPLDIKHLDQFLAAKFVSFESEVIRDPFIAVEALLAAKIVSSLKK